jgi:hypothetical protein
MATLGTELDRREHRRNRRAEVPMAGLATAARRPTVRFHLEPFDDRRY